jgi:predicted TIM-barrel fold metal-dependent hydrolase
MTTAAEAFGGIPVVDVDTHLTEPYDLWTSRAPAKWRDRVPQVREADGVPTWFLDGRPFGLAQPAACILKDGSKHHGASFMGLRYDDVHEGASTVAPRLEMMDKTGVWAQIVYPNLLGFGNTKASDYDAGLRMVTTTVYNDAMAELQEESGGRLLPMALLPWWDIDAAVAEAERAKAMGLRGIITNSDPQDAGMPDLGDRFWNPLWAACTDLELPVNFHIGSSQTQRTWFGSTPWPSQGDDQKLAIGGAMMFFSNARVLANLLFSGVCERFPKVQFVSVESGIGWIPYLLENLDYQIDELAPSSVSYLSMKPSEYFRRQMHACFWFEHGDLAHTIKQVGVDNVMFETDFPHPTCLYGNTLDKVAAALSELPESDRRKVLSGNAAKLYRVEFE